MNISEILKNRKQQTSVFVCACGQPAMWQVRMVETSGTRHKMMCGMCWYHADLLHHYNSDISLDVNNRCPIEG